MFSVEAVNFKSFCAGIFFEGRSGSLECHGGFSHLAEIKRPPRALLGVDRDAGLFEGQILLRKIKLSEQFLL